MADFHSIKNKRDKTIMNSVKNTGACQLFTLSGEAVDMTKPLPAGQQFKDGFGSIFRTVTQNEPAPKSTCGLGSHCSRSSDQADGPRFY